MARRRPHRILVLAALLPIAVAMVLTSATPAPGAPTTRRHVNGAAALQSEPKAQSAPAMSLGSQTTWWQPGQPFRIAVRVDANAPEGLELVVNVHAKLATRIAFASSAQGRVAGRATETHTVALTDAPVDENGDRVVEFVPQVRGDGVYPVRVDLRPLGGGASVDELVTHLIAVPAELLGDELAVATIVPVHAPPAVRPDGTVAIDDGRAGRLASLTAALAERGDVPLTLAPTPETVEALAVSPREEDAVTLDDLVTATAGRQVLSGHFVPTNLTTMIDAGLDEESAGQLNRGIQVLRDRLGTAPTTVTRLIDERLSEAALVHLQTAEDVTSLVVPESFLDPIARNTTLTATFGMESRRGPVTVAAADTALAGHFGEDDPVLGAQRLLADLAQLYNDDPPARRRGVVVSPSRTWQPDGAFIETLLRGLGDSPILRPVDLAGFFDGVDAATTGPRNRAQPLVRRIDPTPGGAPTAPALPGSAIRSLRRDVDAFASAVPPDAEAGQAVLDRLDRTLLTIPSVDLRIRDRTQYLAGVRAQLDAEIAGIAMPQDRSITLTAREGEIPITISRSLEYPVRVRVRVSGAPFDFPDGAEQQIELARENTTSSFAVRAPSSGSFSIRVELLTPEGDLELTQSRFTVRSTAISGVGTALSIGAGLFLVIWWGNHLRGRRSKRLVPAAHA